MESLNKSTPIELEKDSSKLSSNGDPSPVAEIQDIAMAENSRFYDASVNGDMKEIVACISDLADWLASKDDLPPRSLDLEARHENGCTALHAAAANSHVEVVTALLDAGANPCSFDDHLRPPIYLARDKATRDAFRIFRAKEPDRWNWSESRVPEPLTDELLLRKKQKEREKKKRQKERKKKEKDIMRKKGLSATVQAECASPEVDPIVREAESKCTTAAEVKCDSCGNPIMNLGSAFSRLSFNYCSSRCVQDHRRRLAVEAAERRVESSVS